MAKVTIDTEDLAKQINDGVAQKVKEMKVEFRKGAVQLDAPAGSEGNPGGDYGRILFKKAEECNAEEKEFRKFNDELLLAGILLAGVGATAEGIGQRIRVMKRFQSFTGRFKERTEFAKAMDAATAAAGGSWVPTGFSSTLIDLIRVESRLAGLFIQAQMSQNPQIFPSLTADPDAYKGAENTARTAGTAATGKITLTASKIICPVEYSYELDEDAVFAIMPVLQDSMSKKIAYAIDDTIVNGDTAATLDSDIPAANAAGGWRRNWKGLRKLAQAQGSSMKDMGTFTWANWIALKGMLGKFALSPSKLVAIGGPTALGKLEALTNTAGDPLFPNGLKYDGTDRISGIQIIGTDVVREDLNVSGVYDGTTKTKTIGIIARTDAYMLGNRGALLVETQKDIEAQTNKIVASVRKDFQPRQAATETTVVVGYNIA
jgi:HK97 family phage major capsid protein